MAGLLCAAIGSTALAAPTCIPVATITLAGKVATPHHPAQAARHAYRLADGSVIFLGRLAVDADGSPKAYNPDGVSGQDYLANGGHPGDWWALATDANDCDHSGTPLVQQQDDPAPGYYVTTTTLVDASISSCRKQRRYVNSDVISFVALPAAIARIHRNKGNLVVALPQAGAKGQVALLADAAGPSGMGEGSMEFARRLGFSPNPKHGGEDDRTITYVVLPQTHGFPQSENELLADGEGAYTTWGGDERLAVCRVALASRPK